MVGIYALIKTWYKANIFSQYGYEKTRKPVLIGVNERQNPEKPVQNAAISYRKKALPRLKW